jgi:transposase-like protein
MENETRRHFTPEEKVQILRRHLLDKVALSSLCDEHKIAPNLLYRWQKEFFENGAAAFQKQGGKDSRSHQLEEKVAALQARLAKKDEVIAEIMASHVELKKSLGEI